MMRMKREITEEEHLQLNLSARRQQPIQRRLILDGMRNNAGEMKRIPAQMGKVGCRLRLDRFQHRRKLRFIIPLINDAPAAALTHFPHLVWMVQEPLQAIRERIRVFRIAR